MGEPRVADYEVLTISDEKILLVRRDFEVVWTNNTLVLVGVVKALHVVEVGNIKSSDVISEGESKVSELAVI